MTERDIFAQIANLRSAGVLLWSEHGALKYRAPKGMVTRKELGFLKENKQKILHLLEEEEQAVTVTSHPEERYEPFPMTDIQSAYMLGRSSAFDYGGVACHIYLEINYPRLDPERVQAVWNRLIVRHEMLRTVMHRDGYQTVMQDIPTLEIPVHDCISASPEAMEEHLKAVREDMSHRVYDVERWPLFGVELTQGPDGDILHFSIEFLIADWTSIWMLLSEFETCYDNPDAVLPELTISFRDYILAERQLRGRVSYHQDRRYWLDRLAQLPDKPDLPLARDSAEAPPLFERHYLRMPPEPWEQFKKLAQQHGVTATTAVLAAYGAVLARWSRTKQFCINLTVLNRLPLHEQVMQIMGDFTSISLLEVDMGGEKSFLQNVRDINAQLFEDLDHRLFSGVEVLRELSQKKGGHPVLMPYVFTSAIGLLKGAGADMKGQFEGVGISQTPQVFIDCQAMDGAFGLQVNWDSRKNIFPDGMIDDMFQAFEALLNQLAQDSAAWEQLEPVALPAWQQEERQKVNDTAHPIAPRLLHAPVIQWMKEHPERTAVIDSRGSYTYGQLYDMAAAAASRLEELGCAAGENVAIVMQKSVWQTAAALAILSLNAVYVPIDASQAELRREKILRRAGIRFAVAVSWEDCSFPDDVTVIQADTLNPSVKTELTLRGNPSDRAYIIHTSGSTGEPKGVVISHQAAANTIDDLNERFGVCETDCILGLSQLNFDLSVYDIFGVLAAGGTLVLPDADRQKDPSHWAALMREHHITLWNSVPALLQMLVTYLDTMEDQNAAAELRLVMLSGDWIPLNLPDALLAKAPKAHVIGMGGATEASIWSIWHDYKGLEPEWTSIPYGVPLYNQGYRALDSNMQDCPVWVPGELYITGVGLADGYYGEEELTKRSFFPHPHDGQMLYRTGDIGRYTPGGEIEFLGREDGQIKIHGHRIELGEIESTLQKAPGVKIAAIGMAGTGDNRKLVAFVIPETQPDEQMEDTWEKFLCVRLPEYMMPEKIVPIDALPLTKNGKVDKKELAHMALDVDTSMRQQEKDIQASAPTSELEERLVKIAQEALGTESLGCEDNFYEYGADSLIMARIAGEIKKELTLDLEFDQILRGMLNQPTVRHLGHYIEHETEKQTVTVETSASGHKSNASLSWFSREESGVLRVMFHAGYGDMNCYRFMSDVLVEQHLGPVLGIGIEEADPFCALSADTLTVDLAEDYAKCILETGFRQVQLIGYCYGGWVAAVVGNILKEQGVEVLDLIMIDSQIVPYFIKDELIVELFFLRGLGVPPINIGVKDMSNIQRGLMAMFSSPGDTLPEGSMASISGDPGLDEVGRAYTKLGQMSREERFTLYAQARAAVSGGQEVNATTIKMLTDMYRIFAHIYVAEQYFTSHPYKGDAVYCFAIDGDGIFYRQEDVCTGKLTLLNVPGDHGSCIQDRDHGIALAKMAGERLSAALKNERKDEKREVQQ